MLSKQRNAAWNPGDWGGEEGGGGAAEAACFPSSQPRGTPPTPSPGCGAGEEGGGCGSRLFSISLLQTKAEKSTSSAASPVCSTLNPERVSASAQSRLPSLPKCPKTRRALGTCPAAVRRASRAGRSRPALARLQPRGRGCRLRGLFTGTPLQARACSGSRWKAHPGSGFSKHTFVSTHDTGARAHTLQARAHSPAGCRRRAPAARRRMVAGSALGAPLSSRPASTPGCGEPWRSGRTPGSLPPWRRPNPILPGQGCVGADGRRAQLAGAGAPEKAKKRVPCEPGTLQTLFFVLSRARSNVGPKHGLNYHVRDIPTLCPAFCFSCKPCH